MKKDGLYDVKVANPSRGCSMIYEGLPNAPSTAHGACSAAATELRRSRCCDGAAQTSSVALIASFCASRLKPALIFPRNDSNLKGCGPQSY